MNEAFESRTIGDDPLSYTLFNRVESIYCVTITMDYEHIYIYHEKTITFILHIIFLKKKYVYKTHKSSTDDLIWRWTFFRCVFSPGRLVFGSAGERKLGTNQATGAGSDAAVFLFTWVCLEHQDAKKMIIRYISLYNLTNKTNNIWINTKIILSSGYKTNGGYEWIWYILNQQYEPKLNIYCR